MSPPILTETAVTLIAKPVRTVPMIPRNSSFQKRDLSVLGLSIFVHVVALAAMTLVTIAGTVHAPFEAIESILTDEMRTPEEFTSELNTDREIAESMNLVPGGAVVTGVEGAGGAGGTGGGGGGGGGLAADHAKIDNSAGFRDPTVGIGTGGLALPGLESLGNDLG